MITLSKKLFSIFAICCLFFTYTTSIYASDKIYLGGDSIGIEARYEGVLVTGTYSFEYDGKTYDPSSNVHINDKIIAIGGNQITSLQEMYDVMSTYQQSVNTVTLTIERDGKNLETSIQTIYDSQQHAFKSGLYVKDSITGIGTLTYYDPVSQTYGALGHEITDQDTHEMANIKGGTIYPATITSIQKAKNNVAGEKHANIDYTLSLGTIEKNTPIGIYGTYEEVSVNAKSVEWATIDEVELGKATIYTVVDGTTIQEYEIEITSLQPQTSMDIKGISFKVTDENLIEASNGIVQGMSGSPIMQNGKIIGAVTHVVTSNPRNGYGVYIQWMLEQSRS